MNKANVVIVTRTKNRSIFLKRAISSVAGQTYRDYVHLIINDGGDKHDVEEVIKQSSESAKANIQVFHRAKSSNAPDTIFNESIDRVDSEYVVIHDDDDSWHEDFLRRTVKVLDSKKDVAGVVVRTDKIIERIHANDIRIIKTKQYQPDVKAIGLYRQCVDNQLTPISFLYRRKAYLKVGKYDETLPVVGDWEFGIRILLQYDVEYLDPGFALANYHHRKKPDNSFAAHNHRYYFNLVANRYLRKDLANGGLGVGYIISNIRYQQSFMGKTMRKIAPNFINKWLID